MVIKSWRILENSRKRADLGAGAAGRKVSSSFFFFNPSVFFYHLF